MSYDRQIIEIEKDHIKITTIQNGIASSKATSLADLQSVLVRDRNLETPLLPGFWGTQKFVSSGDRELVVFTAPPHIRTVTYNYRGEGDESGPKRFKLPLPGTLWIMTIGVGRNGGQETRQLRHTMGYAIKQAVLGERDQLYYLPFSNVGSDYICWGGNDPRLGGSKSAQSIPEAFFNNSFNSDLDGNRYTPFNWKKEIIGADGMPIESPWLQAFRCSHLFEYHAQEQAKAEREGRNADFKYDILRSANVTVGDAIRNHISRLSHR